MASKNNKVDYSSVPTTAEFEAKGNHSKYTVNPETKSGITLSKLQLFLMALGAILLIGLAIGLTILLYPRCSVAEPEALIQQPPITARRLPTSLQPQHYRLQLIPFLNDNNFTTSGAVKITFLANEDTNKIVINVFDITVDKESLKVKEVNASQEITIDNHGYDNLNETYTISLKDVLEKGKQYDLEIKFIGNLNDKMQGFYRSHYVDPKTQSYKWMASTQFSPTDARRAFPCFDEPALKATFSISIGRPSSMNSISNMPKKTTDTMIDKTNWEWDHYIDTPPMSTYLIAFVVSDLQAYRYNSSGKLFTVHTRMQSVDQTKLVIDLSPKILNFYENYFNIKFPLLKIDLVAVPDFGFNAMENWGLITFRETAMLYDENSATIEDKRHIFSVLAHELAHQWFGNLVTPKWWNDLWLKEGFSSYLNYLAIQQIYPSWKILEEILSYETYAAFKIDAYKSSRPITFDVITSNDIRQMFDSISYSKGSAIIRMLNHILGEEIFKEGLIKFLNQHKYKNADRDDLWYALMEEIKNNSAIQLQTSIKEIMDSWTIQAGFPVVTVTRNHTTGLVHATQKRFLYNKNLEDNTLWWIPISYMSDVKPQPLDNRPTFWLKNERSSSFMIEADRWWLLNLQQTGYYIVNYDESNWRQLVNNIMYFDPITRVQLISDAMELARANLLDYDIPLRMLTNIAIREEDTAFIAHYASLNKVSYLYDMLILSPAFKKFETFLYRIFERKFNKFDFNVDHKDEYLIQRVQKLMMEWACKQSESRCLNEARRLFRNWVDEPDNLIISPNMQYIVICSSVRDGNEAEWNAVYNRFITAKSIYEKNILLDALGCSRIPWILSKYLNFILQNNTDIRKQDSSRIFKAVANNPIGHSIAFSYLRENWKKLNDHYGPAFSIVSKMVAELPVFMNTRYQLAELEDFKNSNINNLGTSSQAFDRAIEIVNGNVEWMDHSYSSIEKWLDEHAHTYGY